VEVTEFCDDGNLGGCMNDCSGPNPGYTCSGGSLVSPSICFFGPPPPPPPPPAPPAPPAPTTPPIS